MQDVTNPPIKRLDAELAAVFREYYRQHGRQVPWREKGLEPYTMLISEVLLRRTVASKVKAIWAYFFARFPTVNHLTLASEEEIAAILEPLGLQNQRASQLKALARTIKEDYDSKIPTDRESILSLPGVGQYAADALLVYFGWASSAPRDVNIERVMNRLNNWAQLPHDFQLEPLFAHSRPDSILYGILDLSSALCRPQSPRCSLCPLEGRCGFTRSSVAVKVSQSHGPGSSCVAVLKSKEWREFTKNGALTKLHSLKDAPSQDCWIYVQKPRTAFVGKARGELFAGSMRFTGLELCPEIPLIAVMNKTRDLRLRAPVSWVNPGDKFDGILNGLLEKRSLSV